MPPEAQPPLKVLLAAPRGFCAGVERAIQAVETLLEREGPPVYVRHEIVHNRRVVEGLAAKGAVFVEELEEVPEGAVVVTSAHGAARAVGEEARRRGLAHVDATCPLVEKVHAEVRRHAAAGCQTILVGHRGHPEVRGTLGQAPPGRVLLVETLADCESVAPEDPERLAWATQTTLSVSDAAAMIRALKARFPAIQGPARGDICYATENRQAAVAALAPECDAFLVLGSANSSNSLRLVETAREAGCGEALRLDDAGELGPLLAILQEKGGAGGEPRTLGLTAGASAPEALVGEVLKALGAHFSLAVEERRTAEETLRFKPPRGLARPAAPASPAPSPS